MHRPIIFFQRLFEDTRWALLILIISVGLAFAINTVRPEGSLLWIAAKEYAIFKPCPEIQGDALPISYQEAMQKKSPRSLLIDARSEDKYQQGHIEAALNIPFDFLYPIDRDQLHQILKDSPAEIIVYGDADQVNLGEELAKEIAGNGLKNVYYIHDPITYYEKYFSTQ